MDATAATLLSVVGSAIFLVGAGIGLPRVFTEPDPAVKLQVLEGRMTQWRIAQPFYAIGPVVAALGVGVLAGSAADHPARVWLAVSCLALLAGSLCWSWSVYQRFRYVREFALGELPGWTFASYVWLTLIGLAALGIGLLIAGYPAWTGWVTLAGSLAFLAVYVRFRDMPPFVFDLLLPIVSVGWL